MSESIYEGIKHVVRVSSCGCETPELVFQNKVNGLLGEGYKLLHVGSESNNGTNPPTTDTVAILGSTVVPEPVTVNVVLKIAGVTQ